VPEFPDLKVRAGSGGPLTARGRSIAYGPPPWDMRGRTLSVQFLLADPAEARRHVPSLVSMDTDPVVRARMWDMEHDALGVLGDGDARWTRFREAVVAFPVSHGTLAGDYPSYMYADEASYTAMGREVMGWPIRDGIIEIDPEPPEGLGAGTTITGRLHRNGTPIMTVGLTLTGERREVLDGPPPRWIVTKIIPDARAATAAVAQLIATGPERIRRRVIWSATASLSFGAGAGDELEHLEPRRIVSGEYWTDQDLTVGWASVLAELGPDPW
jgi:acetoacetate decarboxylase